MNDYLDQTLEIVVGGFSCSESSVSNSSASDKIDTHCRIWLINIY